MRTDRGMSRGNAALRSRRAGFTLLEVLLASLIAVFLLGGLYVMFDITIRQTQEARDVVDSSSLSRNVFNRMALDFACTLTPLPPKSGGNSTGSVAASTTNSGTSTGTTSSSTGSASTGTGTESTGTTTETIDGTTAAAADVPFQAGVVGTAQQVTMFVSRVPQALGDASIFSQIQQGSTGEGTYSDLVKVTYWMGSNGGLCRQEHPWVTADGVRNTVDPDRSDEANDVITEEVTNLSFEYFDQSAGGWVTEWDGSAFGPDGVTPLGPPRAVRVTLTVSIASSRPNQAPTEKTVKQVIPIRTAAGSSTPTILDTTTTTESTGGGM